MTSTDWLIAESLPNWETDQRNEFSYFGVTQRSFGLNEKIKAGDRLITYVIKVGSFSDIREVTKDGLRSLPSGGDYEVALPYCMDTRPLLVLPQHKWLPILEVKDQLQLMAGRPNWGVIFRATPVSLTKPDADLLIKILKSRAVAV